MSFAVQRTLAQISQQRQQLKREWAFLARRFNTHFIPSSVKGRPALACFMGDFSMIFYDPFQPAEQLAVGIANAFDGLARCSTQEGRAEHQARAQDLRTWAEGGPAPSWLEASHV